MRQVAAGFLAEPTRAESLMLRALEFNPRFATHGELAFLSMYAGRLTDAVMHMAALAIDSGSALNRGGLAQNRVADRLRGG